MLTTADGAMSAGPSVTTIEHDDARRSEAEAAGGLASPGYDAYLRRDTAEWRDELAGWQHVDAVSAALDGVTLFVSVTDSDETEAIENRSATELNPAEVGGAFLRRYES
ncbi:hypothetical protein [Microbacterium sp. 1P06AB]|uniref:hypothetical protein n=1 Tax=Microbacterium sp. 1P06AB TaxID=3132289 RepID=UPI0039A4144E